MDADVFQDLFDKAEEILADNGYILDPEAGWSYDSMSSYTYRKDHDSIDLKIQSGVCTQVPTGRMVQETKKDCTFITV
jgi:hypothetical protein